VEVEDAHRGDSDNVTAVSIAVLTPYLTGYRNPLFSRLAERWDAEILCYGGGERYAPAWLVGDLDRQLALADFPARRLRGGAREAFAVAGRYRAVIAPYGGGAILPAAYAGARRRRGGFVLWASVWAQPWSLTNALALPATRWIYRHADAVVAYGEHARRFVAGIRGADRDVFVAPQSVEPEIFARRVGAAEVAALRSRERLGDAPLVLYAGRLVPEKGVEVLLEAWRQVGAEATLLIAGDGPLRSRCIGVPRVRWIGPVPRGELPVLYAASALSVLASIPTRRFREPWGLVCNEAMHQARPVVASDAVGAVAGGLVRDGATGLVVPAGDAPALADAIERLLRDPPLARGLGERGRAAVGAHTYEAMLEAFDRALALALSPRRAAR
jgi:glycosyltransferase involved in cell wall biosynthesis